MELYNEVLYDLLGSGDMTENKLSIYDDPVNQVIQCKNRAVENSTEKRLTKFR